LRTNTVPRRGDNRVVADPVAIASVVSTASVAIAVPFITSRLEQKRLRYRATGERLSELRGLLDDAAVHLTQALASLHDLEQTSQEERREAAGEQLVQLNDQVFRDNIRLSMRLGREHVLVASHQRASD
jgi:hypothetical protein